MTKYIVEGGRPLFGEIHISGAKNAAVAIIPAALMVSGPCRIENIPQISDVTLLLGILQDLGARVRFLNPHTVEIDCSRLRNGRIPYESARRCRASYYMLGALLGRFGAADVALPGGCDFGGTRPIDQHLKGFCALLWRRPPADGLRAPTSFWTRSLWAPPSTSCWPPLWRTA